MSGHTPGCWAIEPREAFGRGDRPGSAEVVVWDEDGEGSMIIVRDLDFDDAESQANARLIAAAPELLEAAQKVMQWWADHQYDTCGERGGWNVYDAEPDFVVAARAALIKACGEV